MKILILHKEKGTVVLTKESNKNVLVFAELSTAKHKTSLSKIYENIFKDSTECHNFYKNTRRCQRASVVGNCYLFIYH